KLCLNYVIESLEWFSSRTIGTIDATENLHIIDVKSEEELESVDIGNVKLVYGTEYFESVDTGGNVSKAMSIAAERACYYSLCTRSGARHFSHSQLLLLGMNAVYGYSLRNWYERIDWLFKHNKFSGALFLTLSMYNDEAKAVIGLPSNKSDKKAIIREKMVDLVENYSDLSVGILRPDKDKIDVLRQHYTEVIQSCLHYCLAVNRSDLIFPNLYEKFSNDPLAKAIFLESLEFHILNSELHDLSPVLVKDLVNHYEERKKFNELESIILRLNIDCLDIHQLITLCRKEKMYDGIIYIHNQAFDEYITPFEELFSVLLEKLLKRQQLTNSEIILASKILVYINCCLTGRIYPMGELHISKRQKVRRNILRTICQFKLHDYPENEINKDIKHIIYPYLRALLNFDAKEFFKVLSLAFEELDCMMKDKEEIQHLIDILLHIMSETSGFNQSQICAFFTFLSRQVARPENPILTSNLLFDQVQNFMTIQVQILIYIHIILQIIEHLTMENSGRVDERQHALLDLLHSGKIDHIPKAKLLNLSEKAKFYRVCESIHWEQRAFDKILSCYLNDDSRKVRLSYLSHFIIFLHFSSRNKYLPI
ncbi:Vacuolar protein sorting-associated protein 8-like protein, partial [Dinothrombium tinctorium]